MHRRASTRFCEDQQLLFENALLTFSTLAIPLGLTLTVLTFLLFAALIDFALRFGLHACVMFGVLGKVFGVHAIIRQLRIAR